MSPDRDPFGSDGMDILRMDRNVPPRCGQHARVTSGWKELSKAEGAVKLDGAEGSRPPGGSVSGASAHLGSGLAPTLPTWDKVTAQTAHVLGQNSLPKKGASANLREKVGN